MSIYTAKQTAYLALANAQITNSQKYAGGSLVAQRGTKPHFYSEVLRCFFFMQYNKYRAKEARYLGNLTNLATYKALSQSYLSDMDILKAGSNFGKVITSGQLANTSYL